MSWTLIAYIVGGLFVVFYVLPKVLRLIAHMINRYLHGLPPILAMTL
jgi:hypothetical protein